MSDSDTIVTHVLLRTSR